MSNEAKTPTVYSRLQDARVELDKMKLKKTGRNKFSDFSYYELGDFLPAVNSINSKKGLMTRFLISPKRTDRLKDDNGQSVYHEVPEMAYLRIHDTDRPQDSIAFSITTAEVEIGIKKDGSGGAQPIQNLGGKTTYLRRYLLMIAYEIAENDWVDPEEKAKENEIDIIEADKIAGAKDLDDLATICGDLKTKLDKKFLKSLSRHYEIRKNELMEGGKNENS